LRHAHARCVVKQEEFVKAVRHLILATMVLGLISLPLWAQSSDKDKASGDTSATQSQSQQSDQQKSSDRSDQSTQAQTDQSGKSGDQQKTSEQSDTAQSGKAQEDQAGGQAKLSAADKTFVKKAVQGGKAEVELGELAQEKASSEEVKNFAKHLVDDHRQANEQLMKIAQDKGVEVPDQVDPKHQAVKDRLSKLSGEQFDRAFMQEAVKDHQKDVREYRQQSKLGKDPDLKNYASSTLPKLQEHLKTAKSLSKTGAKQQKKQGAAQAKY
jgi:putative membrane protein